MNTKIRTSKSPRPRVAQTLQNRLVQKLPDLLDAAIAAYQQIALSPPSHDPKTFTATQSGAKAALVHIEQIIKLAEAAIVEEEKASKTDRNNIEMLLETARKALEQEENVPLSDPEVPQ